VGVIEDGSGNDEHHDFTHVFLFPSKFDTKRSFFFPAFSSLWGVLLLPTVP